MKSTIKLRKILKEYECTFMLDEEQRFVIFVSNSLGEALAEFKGKSFSIVVGLVYSWLEQQKKKAPSVHPKATK